LNTIELGVQNIQFQIYPNPANEIIAIKSNEILDRIEIIDVRGKMVFSKKTNEFETNVNINSLSAGLYLIKIFSKNNTKSTKFIKE
jgi:hypothetical protein